MVANCSPDTGLQYYRAVPTPSRILRERYTSDELGISCFLHEPPEHVRAMTNVNSGYMLHLITRGSGRLSRRIDDHIESATVAVGDVTLTPSQAVSEWTWDLEGAQVFDVHLSDHVVEKTWESGFSRLRFGVALRPALCMRDENLQRILLTMMAHCATRGPVGDLLLERSVDYALACLFATNGSALERQAPNALPRWRCRHVEEFIAARVSAPITVAQLADHVGMSKFHFMRSFRVTYGVSPHRYIVSKRLGLARRLLRESPLAVADIATRCGFADATHFSRLFRRSAGLSPTEYRRTG